MTVKKVSDLCLRAVGQGFTISLIASYRYFESSLERLERTIALVAFYVDEQGWPPVRDNSTGHIEEYLIYILGRPRWFGARGTRNPRPVFQGYVEAQYRRLNRFSVVWLNMATSSITLSG